MIVHEHPDIGIVVKATVHQFKEQAQELGVALEFEGESDLPLVMVHEPYFMNALGRLIDNGIKFSQGEGSTVTISTRATEEWVEISVTDRGIGIAPKELDHIFERFRQIDRDRMEQQGSGLGLALATELVRLHGGEITVKSELGKGSTFTIRLPVAEN
jgi:two-component system sensor histidine kinase SenX3